MTQVFRFIRILRRRGCRETIMLDKIQAHKYLIRIDQFTVRQNTKFAIWSQQFGLFEDHNKILRCRGRLANANLPTETAFPIFLEKSHLSELLARDCLERVRHSGVTSTLTELRSRYWITKGRQLVKRVINNCTVCRRFQRKAYKSPPPPPLPLMRVDEKPPFSYTGVDFTGPVYTRETLQSESKKAWICLYTCCVTRAVHLDLVVELTTVAFLRCFKRFTSRRGIPIKVLSDNAKTFKAADKIISTILDHPTTRGYFIQNQIQWQFNVAKAPWWGGVFERMVQSTKRLLRKIIGKSKLTFDELLTAVIEVKALLNSRPITYIGEELIEPLTPSHLLSGRRLMTLPDDLIEEDEYLPEPDTVTKVTRRMKHLSSLLNNFWVRWRNEYLLELRSSQWTGGSKNNPKSHEQVSVGDVVVIEEEGLPRGFWKLGKVTRLMTGRDGNTRAAQIKTHSNDGKIIHMNRPIQKLYPLEVREVETQPVKLEYTGNSEIDRDQITTEVRPKRASTARARKRIASWIEELTSDSDQGQ